MTLHACRVKSHAHHAMNHGFHALSWHDACCIHERGLMRTASEGGHACQRCYRRLTALHCSLGISATNVLGRCRLQHGDPAVTKISLELGRKISNQSALVKRAFSAPSRQGLLKRIGVLTLGSRPLKLQLSETCGTRIFSRLCVCANSAC